MKVTWWDCHDFQELNIQLNQSRGGDCPVPPTVTSQWWNASPHGCCWICIVIISGYAENRQQNNRMVQFPVSPSLSLKWVNIWRVKLDKTSQTCDLDIEWCSLIKNKIITKACFFNQRIIFSYVSMSFLYCFGKFELFFLKWIQ